MDLRTVDHLHALRIAEDEVAPFIGKVPPQRTATDTYKLALDSLGVDVTGVHRSAYRDILLRISPSGKPRMARDAASRSNFDKLFPDAPRVRQL